MISCNLQGGLGNQMFQIAATYALALRNNDTCGFEFEKCYTPKQGFSAKKYSETIYKKINKINNYIFTNYYIETFFGYKKIQYQQNLLLTGYFQSEKYFEDYKEQVKNLFYFSNEYISEVHQYLKTNINNNNLNTVVHIRRGDYLLFSDFHSVCELDYYNESIKNIGDSNFIFISDDIQWVKKHFNLENYFFAEFNDEILELTLMTLVDNVIISNSSFSWWGAYLNRNKNKTVIAPKKWFGKNGPKDIENLLPEEWKTI